MNRLRTCVRLWICMGAMVILHLVAPALFSSTGASGFALLAAFSVAGSSWYRWIGGLPIDRIKWLNREWLVNMAIDGPTVVVYLLLFCFIDGKGVAPGWPNESLGAFMLAGLGAVSLKVPLELWNRQGNVTFSWNTVVVILSPVTLLVIFMVTWAWEDKFTALVLSIALLLAIWVGSYLWSRRLVAS